MTRLPLFTFAIILLAFTACKQKSLDSQLPAATQVGAMTFGCVLNGNHAFSVHGDVVTTGSGLGSTCSGGVVGTYALGGFHLYAVNCPAQTYQVYINIADSAVHTGTYSMGYGPAAATASDIVVVYRGIYGNIQDTSIYYQCDSTHGGTVTFTRASAADSIYSGTFSATLTDGHNAFTVTNGRFDLKAQ